jgi:hypothetical protein
MEEVVDFIVRNIDSEMPEHYKYGYIYKEDDEDECFHSILQINEWFKEKLDERLDKKEILFNSVDVYDIRTNLVSVFIYKNKRCEISEKFGRENYWVIFITDGI